MFLVFGLNGFLNFIPSPPPTGLAAQFLGALFVSHYLVAVFVLQIVAGTLLLANRFVPAALTILGRSSSTSSSSMPSCARGLRPAVIAVTLWSIVFVRERSAFLPLLAAKSGSC